MKGSQFPQLTIQDALESYKDIELSKDDIDFLILKEKIRIRAAQQDEKLKSDQHERRMFLTQKTNYHLVKGLMMMRAKNKFDPELVLDEHNEIVFELLCRYFGNDKDFVSLAMAADIGDPSLEKGIMLCGIFGVGKTWMMELFRSNQRMCYQVMNAKDIAEDYRTFKVDPKSKDYEDPLHKYLVDKKNAVEDPSVFYQTHLGLCIDDIGTEDVKNNFGNKKNVIGDIIELRYQDKLYGKNFHATTNLTVEQLDQYYGGRVRSRLRQMFNFIELGGNDRRK